jgi:SpoVK/Ycf46/Vps4 family AAA+-type ATPase
MKWIGGPDKFLFLRANMEKLSIIFREEIDHLLPKRIEANVAGLKVELRVVLIGEPFPEHN